MSIRQSARKHGIRDDDIIAASESPILSGPLDDDSPQRVLILGWDNHGRVLELVVLIHDNGTEETIHVIENSAKYLDLLS